MKQKTTLSIREDLLEEARIKGLNVSEIADGALFKALNKKEIKIDSKELRCSWCKGAILNDEIEEDYYIFYQCVHHNHLFCYNCAHNRIKKEVNGRNVYINVTKYVDCPKCLDNYRRTDCIFEKRKIKMQEVEEEEIKEKE